jgi:hypothetical protein
MWYLLAQANGLQIQPEAALKEFTTLTVPNVVTNFHNTSETNRVYNAAWALGDTSPSLPAPQLPPPQSSGKCGGMGQVLTIVMAVAATVLTAGAAAVAMGAVTGAASTFGAGMTALSGGLAGSGSLATAGTLAAGSVAASTGVGVAAAGAAALGGAAGSIAGQGLGMALGNRASFSWREVAMSAVGSAIGSGVGQSGLGQLTFGLQGNGAGIASAMARSAITSSALQAVSLGTGSQGRFSWRAVAASAVGAGVGAGMGAAFGASAPPGGIGMTPAERFGELARGTVYGIAAGSAASAIGSGRVMARQVAVDAFGNALGNGLMAAGSDAQRESARREALFSLSQGSTGSTAPSLRVTEGARELWNTLADEAVGVSSDWRQAGAQGWPLLAGAGSMRIEAPVDGRPMVASARSAMSNLLTGTQTGVGWSVQAQRRAEELRMQGVAEFGAALEQTRSDPRIGEQMREFAQRQFDRGGLNQGGVAASAAPTGRRLSAGRCSRAAARSPPPATSCSTRQRVYVSTCRCVSSTSRPRCSWSCCSMRRTA